MLLMKKIILSLAVVMLMLSSASYALSAMSEDERLMEAAAHRVPEGLRLKVDDIYMGEKEAPVQIVEYASMTCAHCQKFHTSVLSKLKETYIKEGKVRFTLRELPWDNMALAVSKVARCAPKEQYYSYIDAFFATRDNWLKDKDPLGAIKKVARLGGMTGEMVEACLKDEDIHQIILNNKTQALEELGVNGTPTLFINGQMFEGVPTMGELSTRIDALIEAKK